MGAAESVCRFWLGGDCGIRSCRIPGRVFSGQGRDEAAAATAAADSASARLTVRALRLSMFMAVALPTMLFIVAAWIFYVQAFDDARLRVDREARIAQEHASKIMENNASMKRAVLDFVARMAPKKYSRMSASCTPNSWRWARAWNSCSRYGFWILPVRASRRTAFFLYRESTRRIASFSLASGKPPRRVYISEPLISRTTGEAFFDVSRRWDHDGKFAGVVTVSLYPTYFTEFYRGMALDSPGLMVMMVRSDGAVIARWPIVEPNESRLESNSALSKAMAAGDMQGRIEGVSSVDGEDRLNAFRRLERYPIYVLAGIDRDAIIAGWQRQLAVLAAFTFPISMALVYVAWVALRRTRRELAAQQSLQHEIEQSAHRKCDASCAEARSAGTIDRRRCARL